MSIVAFLIFEVGAEDRDTFFAAAVEVMRASRLEEGCIVYDFGADLADPRRFQITEVWESQEALDAHHATPHARAATAILSEVATVVSMKLWSANLVPVGSASAKADAVP